MIKEEWRIHSTLFGSLLFFLFPFLIMALISLTYFFGPVIQGFFSLASIVVVMHCFFLFFGINVGAFGLHGTEFMNRRFGHASLMAYSSRSLPVSEQSIFLNMVLKDIVYYFFMFILPISIALGIGGSFFGITVMQSLILLISLTLAFLIGLSAVFFLSTLYAHSVKILISFVGAIAAVILLGHTFFGTSFPQFIFFLSPDTGTLIFCLLIVAIPSILSVTFLKIDYPDIKEESVNKYNKTRVFFSKLFSDRAGPLLAKDFLDLRRSRGGVGKIIFSLLFPMTLIWFFINYFSTTIKVMNVLAVFSVILATYTVSIYNWITEYDVFTNYSFLPIRTSEVVKSKARTTLILSFISIVIFFVAAIHERSSVALIGSFLSYLCMFLYGLALTIYLTGLNPNVLLMNPKVLLAYLLCIIPPALIIILGSFVSMYFLLICLLLLPLAWNFFNKGLKKWDAVEQLTY